MEFLQSKVFADTDDIKVRKLIVNTFIREIIYYLDKIIITYNFMDIIDTVKIKPENSEEIEKQSQSASSLNLGSCLLPQSAPQKTNSYELVFFFVKFVIFVFLLY